MHKKNAYCKKLKKQCSKADMILKEQMLEQSVDEAADCGRFQVRDPCLSLDCHWVLTMGLSSQPYTPGQLPLNYQNLSRAWLKHSKNSTKVGGPKPVPALGPHHSLDNYLGPRMSSHRTESWGAIFCIIIGHRHDYTWLPGSSKGQLTMEPPQMNPQCN